MKPIPACNDNGQHPVGCSQMWRRGGLFFALFGCGQAWAYALPVEFACVSDRYEILLLLLLMVAVLSAWGQWRTRRLRAELAQRSAQLQAQQQQMALSQQQMQQSNQALNDANVELALSVATLRQLGEVGREITVNLEAEIVFQSLWQHARHLLNASAVAIFHLKPGADLLELAFGRDGNEALRLTTISLYCPDSFVAKVARERQELLIDFDMDSLGEHHVPGTRLMLSGLFAPLIVANRVLGVITVQTEQRHAFGERECMIFRNLSAYGGIALANARALSALRETQEQLVQQEKLASLGALVGGIAHEINTPLGTGLMALSGAHQAWQRVQRELDEGSLSKSGLQQACQEANEYTRLALQSGDRIAQLVNVFKTIAVPSNLGQREQFSLDEYLHEIAALVRAPLEARGVALQITVSPGLQATLVPEALTEALSRILANVQDHAFIDTAEHGGGTLTLSAQAQGQEIVIEVCDDGHGIAAADLPKVFDPFFSTRGGAFGHVGLGLHVAYNHVTQGLGGRISIRSELGKGTCVSLYLPALV